MAYEKGRPIPIANLITICKKLETSIDLITTKKAKIKVDFIVTFGDLKTLAFRRRL